MGIPSYSVSPTRRIKMARRSFKLPKPTIILLEAERARTGLPIAEIVRRALDAFLVRTAS